MALGTFVAIARRILHNSLQSGSVGGRADVRRRRRLPTLPDCLEDRVLLTVSHLHTLESRPGVPVTASGIGKATAANENYHVTGHPFFGFLPEGFPGEVQIHDAGNGNLLRVIANPEPELLYRFGESVALSGNLLLVGAVGQGEPILEPDEQPSDDPFSDQSGRVYLFNASTGNLLHTFVSDFTAGNPFPDAYDHFGEKVEISGDYVAISAPSARLRQFGVLGDDFEDPGRVYVFSASTGDLLHVIENPDADPGEGFGLEMSLSGTNLLVTAPFDDVDGPRSGSAYVFDITTGDLLHTLKNPDAGEENRFGGVARISGDTIAIVGEIYQGLFELPLFRTYIFDADTGDLLRTFASDADGPGFFGGLSGSQLITVTVSPFVPWEPGPTLGNVFDATTGALLDTIPVPAGFTGLNYTTLTTFQDRLLFSNYSDSENIGEIYVYEIPFTGENSPPTDITLSNSSVPENSPGGTLVGTLSAVDPDAGETFDFELLNSAGGRFVLNGAQLLVAATAALDFETQTSHSITVQVTDSAGHVFSRSLVIPVTNQNEPPTDLQLSGSTAPESSVRVVHPFDAQPAGAFGQRVAVAGNRMLIAEVANAGSGSRGRVSVVDTATGQRIATLTAPGGNVNLQYSDGLFGSDVVLAGDLAIVSAPWADVGGVESAGMVYVFDASTGGLLRTLTSPSPSALGFFGTAIDTDGSLLAIGAIGDASFVGAAYLFDAGSGALLQTVPSPTTNMLDRFGSGLSLAANRLVVGSTGVDTGGAESGTAFLYTLDPVTSAATLVATLNNPTPEAGDQYGHTIAARGNLIAIASRDNSGAPNGGVIHVFHSSGAFLRTLASPDPASAYFLGRSLAILGDYVIAGSPVDTSHAGPGIAYVFNGITGALVTTLENPSAANLDGFAEAIATDGSRLVVSAPGDDGDGPNRGLVYVYDLPFGQTVGTLSTTDPDSGETFFYSMFDDADGRFAIRGSQLVVADATKLDFETNTTHDVTVRVRDSGNNVFLKTFMVSVTGVDESPLDITLSAQTVTEAQLRFIHSPSMTPGSIYASNVAADGDLVVAAINTNLRTDVHVSNSATGATVATLTSPSPQLETSFGVAVAISGNLVVVGAPREDAGGFDSGRAYLFNATTGQLLRTLTNPSPAPNGLSPDFFGASVAISGNLIAVSAGQDSGGAILLFDAVTGNLLQTIPFATQGIQLSLPPVVDIEGTTLVFGNWDSNAAFVYEFNPATQKAGLVATLSNPNVGPSGDSFGSTVAITGDFIAVAAALSDAGADGAGQVHVFDRLTGAFVQSINNPTPDDSEFFGLSLATNGGLLAVSASRDSLTSPGSPLVYVFDRATGEMISSLRNPAPTSLQGAFFRAAFTGDRLIVAAAADGTDGAFSGMLYVYDFPFDQVVGTLSGVDPDTGDTLSYTLLDDAGGLFRLVGNEVVVVDPIRLNFEDSPTHTIRVRATDSSGLSTEEPVTIQVLDGNEPTQDVTLIGDSVASNPANGTIVTTFSATDPDAGDSLAYSLVNNAGGRFAISGNSIVVANGSLIQFGSQTFHNIVIKAEDAGGKLVLETLRIHVLPGAGQLDFGDLPITFGTSLIMNGARHTISNGLRLGPTVTAEANGKPSTPANLDTGDDGVTLPPVLLRGLEASFTVQASQIGRLDAFIDFNNNGTFSAAERISPAGGWLVSAGANTFTFTVPSTAKAGGNLAARFRVSSAGGLSATGAAADGEVEDYRVAVAAAASKSVTLLPDPMTPGSTLVWVNGSKSKDVIVVEPVNGVLRTTFGGVASAVTAPLNVSRIVITGSNGNDDIRINGTTIPGVIDGGSGNDILRGGNGADVLSGGTGNDTLYGRDGEDVLIGGAGNDALNSDAGIGYLFGDAGNDTLNGNGVLVGGIGNDTLVASGPRNVLIGGEGKDKLTGANVSEGDLFVTGRWSDEQNLAALRAIHNEWRKNATRAQRIASLNGSAVGGLNGVFVLNSGTLSPDAQIDSIFNFGSTNSQLGDWIFKSANDPKTGPSAVIVTI